MLLANALEPMRSLPKVLVAFSPTELLCRSAGGNWGCSHTVKGQGPAHSLRSLCKLCTLCAFIVGHFGERRYSTVTLRTPQRDGLVVRENLAQAL